MSLEAWMSPRRWYIYAAFLPIGIACMTLVALYYYQAGAVERRDRWQKPDALFDAFGIRPGMSIGQYEPIDPYFQSKLEARVGPSGRVVVIRVGETSVGGLDAVLIVLIGARPQLARDRDALASAFSSARACLKPKGRLGFVGPRPPGGAWPEPVEVVQLGERTGFRFKSDPHLVERQVILLFELP